MAIWNTREKNGLWKGGRSVASNGYVLVRVGKNHHLADVRGYAYEHRLAAEKKIGRRLRPGEIVHHLNGEKTDNRESNIVVLKTRFQHAVQHRRSGKRRRMPDEGNPIVRCACGCSGRFPKFDRTGRVRRFITGHNTGATRGIKITD